MAPSCNRSSRVSPPAASTALLALALVLIHRATGVINFAQGEMAMFSTYIALDADDEPRLLATGPPSSITLLVSFVGGIGIHQAVIRPVERSSQIRVVIVTIGLLLLLNGLDDVDLDGRGAGGAEPVPGRDDRHRRRRDLVPRHRHDRGLPRRRRRALGVLPVHEGRPRAARRRRQPGRGAPRRRQGAVDARPRLGPRGGARRDRRRC